MHTHYSYEEPIKECCINKETCSIHSYKSLDDLTYKIKDRLTYLSFKNVQNLFYGYNCAADVDQEIKRLNILKDSLDRVKISFLHIGKSCLDDETIQKIVEKANKIVGNSPCPARRKDITVDESNINKYLMSSSQCVTYDSWNKFSRFLCGKLGFKVSLEREVCDITFEISRKIISCNLLYALSLHKEMCDLGYKVSRTDQECKVDWKILMEKEPACDLSFKTYAKFVKNSNLSYPLIKEVYASGLTLAEEDGEVVICTPLNNYKLTQITPTSLEELLNLGYIIDLNKYDIINEYKPY